MNIYPAILTQSKRIVQEQINAVVPIEDIETVHIDIIDGSLVENLTVTPLDLIEINFNRLTADIHILTDEPLDYVYEITSIQQPKLPIRAIYAQVEHLSGQQALIEEIQKHGWKAGLSLDFHTPFEAIDDEVWEKLDIIQLMSIEMGFQDQPFQTGVFDKLVELHQELKLRNLKPEIILDGGVDTTNIALIKAAGVHSVSVGSTLWQAESVEDAILELQNAVVE